MTRNHLAVRSHSHSVPCYSSSSCWLVPEKWAPGHNEDVEIKDYLASDFELGFSSVIILPIHNSPLAVEASLNILFPSRQLQLILLLQGRTPSLCCNICRRATPFGLADVRKGGLSHPSTNRITCSEYGAQKPCPKRNTLSHVSPMPLRTYIHICTCEVSRHEPYSSFRYFCMYLHTTGQSTDADHSGSANHEQGEHTREARSAGFPPRGEPLLGRPSRRRSRRS